MEGSVSNVQFTERKRGFDPDEVANYLAHIDDKIAGLRAIAAEAIERAEQAEERARAAEQRVAAAEEGPAQAASVLAMAQQTADATLAQAHTEAESVLARAREDADRHRLSAEAEAQQLLADTRRDLEARRAEHLDALRGEIEELTAVRDAVAADIAALEAHVAAQRSRVLEARDALTLVADDPAALRAVPLPDIATDIAERQLVEDLAVEELAVEELAVEEFADVEQIVVAEEYVVGDVVVDDVVVTDVATGASVEDIVVSDAATGEVVGEAVIVDAGTLDTPAADLPWGTADPHATAPVSAVGGLFDDDAVDEVPEAQESPGAAGLFGEEQDAGAPPETAFGAFDEEDDEAMRAFFESEVDDDRPGRWGFRRR